MTTGVAAGAEARAATSDETGAAAGAATRAMDRLRQATMLVRAAVAFSVPEATAPGEAAELAGMLGDLEKLAAASALRYSLRLGRGAAGLLATVSGTAQGAARTRIETAETIGRAPEVAAAFSRGELSSDQARVLAPVVSSCPREAGSLLRAARSSSLRELRAEAERILRRRKGPVLCGAGVRGDQGAGAPPLAGGVQRLRPD